MTVAGTPVPSTSEPPSGSRGFKKRPKRIRTSFGRKAANLLVWLVVAFNLAVFVWMFLNSWRTHGEIFANPWSPPTSLHAENYVNAWVSSGFGNAIWNSVIVCVTSALAILVLAAPASYILAKTNGWMSEAMLLYMAVGIGIPVQVIVIPLFVVVQNLELLNSLHGLIAVYIGLNLPFTIFLLAGFFRSMPDELEEAAALDGAGPFTIFVKVILPLARSGMITALILNLVWLWAEVFIALVLIQSTDYETLPLALLGFMAKQQYAGADYGQLMAGVCIILLPVLLAYIWLGRRIIEGMTLGANK